MKNLFNLFAKNPILPALSFLGLGFAIFSVFSPPPQLKTVQASPITTPEGYRVYGLGVIEPKDGISVLSVQTSGLVREVFVHTGQKVKKGDPLIALDSTEIDAKLREVEAKLNTAEIAAKESQAYVMNIQHKKATQVLKKDEVQRRYFSQALEVSKVAQIQAELQFLRVQKDFHTIRAPFDGIILERNAHVGEYAQISGNRLSAPLISMANDEVLYVRVEFDEDFRDILSQKHDAMGILKGENVHKVPLKFVRVEPMVKGKRLLSSDASERVDTRVVQILYEINRAEISKLFLLPGMQMDVFVEDKKASGSLSKTEPKT